MSAEQTPPVTVITIPSGPTTTSTMEPVTTTSGPTTTSPPATIESTTETTVATPPGEVAADAAGGVSFGPVVIVIVVVAVAVSVGLVWWRRRSTDPSPAVVVPDGGSLTERVRRAVEEAEHSDPVEHHGIEDVSIADLYPWIDPPDELTLVVDLRTAEALQDVGVTTLDELANMDDELIRSMIEAGIDIDTRAVEAAAQDILGRRTEGGPA
jgi:hypothetical protein